MARVKALVLVYLVLPLVEVLESDGRYQGA